ncbi:MAG: nitrogen regulation protein NR(II) [Gammaproteobacteria bacterium]|nr:nitrogen regulation protein NR(II) [Gammaproteobacteria bacterium]
MHALAMNQAVPTDNGYRILDALNVAILCLDREQRVTYVNASAENLFDSSAGNLAGRKFSKLLSGVEPSSILQRLAAAPQGLTERRAVITLASGRTLFADYSIFPLGDDPDEGELLIEIRPLERQVQFAQEDLQQLYQQASQQLTRSLAHEIKNPLGGIRGAAQLLQRALDNPEWSEFTEIIISEVDRLQALINNMLGPESRLQMAPLNIHEVLEHIRKIMVAAEPERIRFHRDYDPSIPDMTADRDLLIQAFLNIARNAVQAIDGEGEVHFRTRILRQCTIGKKNHPLAVQIDIVDSGRGIAEELAETIFLPMITDKPDGSGLGLPIAQDIVSRHGGTILLQSSSAGTTFSTILPLEST